MKHKKTVLMIVFALIVSGFAAADDSIDLADLGNSIIPYVQLDIMCERGAFLEQDELARMKEYSEGLDPYYKTVLYERYSQDPWGVAAVNLFTGGMGSLINGNVLSGSILQAGFLGSYTVMIMGMIEQNPEVRQTEFLIAQIGAVVFGVAGLVLPFIETGGHNSTLKDALGIDE